MYFTELLLFLPLVITTRANSEHNCTCMPYYQCSVDLENILVDGNELLDVRGFKNPCSGYFDVCCKISVSNSTTIPIVRKGCGYREPNDYPWLGNLYFQRDISSKPMPRCGVSFIHKKAVLTAAHCLDDDGLWTIQKDDTTVNIKGFTKHPDFNPETLHNDIAVIILDESFETISSEHVICVPPPGFVAKNTSCLVGSFDKANDVEEDVKLVRLIELPVIERDRCLESLHQTRLGDFFQLHHSFVCAGGEDNKDTCNGDGGSPLVCPIKDQPGRYHQIGIVSWGIGCGEFNVPGVYVNVAIFRDFIDEVMIENGLSVNGYKY